MSRALQNYKNKDCGGNYGNLEEWCFRFCKTEINHSRYLTWAMIYERKAEGRKGRSVLTRKVVVLYQKLANTHL